jgi:hypothetical protein
MLCGVILWFAVSLNFEMLCGVTVLFAASIAVELFISS